MCVLEPVTCEIITAIGKVKQRDDSGAVIMTEILKYIMKMIINMHNIRNNVTCLWKKGM